MVQKLKHNVLNMMSECMYKNKLLKAECTQNNNHKNKQTNKQVKIKTIQPVNNNETEQIILKIIKGTVSSILRDSAFHFKLF